MKRKRFAEEQIIMILKEHDLANVLHRPVETATKSSPSALVNLTTSTPALFWQRHLELDSRQLLGRRTYALQ